MMLCSVHVMLAFALLPLCGSQQASLLESFVAVDYDWQSDQDRVLSLSNGTFIPENNIITGIKVRNGEIFLSVPRWRRGVPSTLNKLSGGA
jgi:hypothetical protein